MVNLFCEYVPTFIDVSRPMEEFRFTTVDELLNHPCVARKRGNDLVEYALNDAHLMMKIEGSWWVVGFIKHPETVDLPKWQGHES